jgi:hypothetical protein
VTLSEALSEESFEKWPDAFVGRGVEALTDDPGESAHTVVGQGLFHRWV